MAVHAEGPLATSGLWPTLFLLPATEKNKLKLIYKRCDIYSKTAKLQKKSAALSKMASRKKL